MSDPVVVTSDEHWDYAEHRWQTCPVFGGCDDCRSSKFEKNSPDPRPVPVRDPKGAPNLTPKMIEREQAPWTTTAEPFAFDWDEDDHAYKEIVRDYGVEAARAWTKEDTRVTETPEVKSLDLDSFLTVPDAVEPAAFNAAVNETLDRAREVSDTRGLEYGDTWALENQFTPFSDSVNRLERQASTVNRLERQASTRPYERYAEIAVLEAQALERLRLIAALIDVKISRMRGPWKADTVEDLINYLAAFRTWRDDFEVGRF